MGIAGVRRSWIALIAAAGLLLTGCANGDPALPVDEQSPATFEQLESLRIDTSDAATIVDGLDALKVAKRPQEVMAIVMPDELQIQPGSISLPLPEDSFYVSIAPYATATHECTFHSLTTCLGELQNTPIELTITDVESGEVVVRDITATADNGFVGAWLPRDRDFLVRIVSAQGFAEQQISTGADDPTCITTMQLTAA